MSEFKFTTLVQSLPSTVPFVGPETQERDRGGPFSARLGANESVFGPSPRAIEAMRAAAAEIWQYADPTCHGLREALAAHYAVPSASVLVGEGIDGILGNLVRLLIEEGDAVVTSNGAYPTFNYHVAGFGGVLHKVNYAGDHEDPGALLRRAREVGAKLIYFANPDNPMGSWHEGRDIEAALDEMPAGALLVLDEAYVELGPDDAAPKIAPDDPRVLRLRTFSKAYGMAGARIGYGIGAPDLIQAFDKIRNHFGVNRVAQAGAMAALRDQEWLAHVQQEVATSRAQLGRIAKDNGLTPLPSATNFVTIDCGRDGDFARVVLTGLLDQGVFVRMPFVPPHDRCIRVGCGRSSDMELVARALPLALQRARAAEPA
ncbi:MAG: pyridoxal phosphate-dependent aminotransferase [Pseudomonadota bacterium]